MQTERRELAEDLSAWVALAAQRRAAFDAAEATGADWAAQAAAQGLPVDAKQYDLHDRCSAFIASRSLERGVPFGASAAGMIGTCSGWRDYERAVEMPKTAAARAVLSDCLSFPLTAAYAAQIAGVGGGGDALSVLVLGAEDSELNGLSKWAEMLRVGRHGTRELRVCFVGPRVPTRLDGSETTLRHDPAGDDGAKSAKGGGERAPPLLLRFAFVRGHHHEAHVRARVPAAFAAPQLALAFNSGLAEHAGDWLPTLRPLLWGPRPIPLALTSYHKPEAELDARTLAVRAAVPLRRMHCEPNPFASKMPHLDELTPGRVYFANAFLTVCKLAAETPRAPEGPDHV